MEKKKIKKKSKKNQGKIKEKTKVFVVINAYKNDGGKCYEKIQKISAAYGSSDVDVDVGIGLLRKKTDSYADA